MSFSLKTENLPAANRPPVIYKATVSAFELRTAQTSGQPNINVTYVTPNGKRFDRINLKSHWFDSDFNPKSITDAKERKQFEMSVGAKGRLGTVRRLLGADYQGEFTTPAELTQVLQATAVGKTFYVRERQKTEKAADGTATPVDGYNLDVADTLPPSWQKQIAEKKAFSLLVTEEEAVAV